VGVFVNADLEAVILKVLNCELGYVQLHGSESPEYCQEVRTYPVKVIKAFGVGRDFDFSQLEPYLPHVDYFLFDTKAETHGGTGVQFDWSVLDAYKLDKPFFLSGGIGPNDVERIQNFRHPQLVGIDLNSKFETEPAYKDIEALKTFIGAVCPSGY
jgi:phosphoribosylanthranilate isomerase